MISIAQFRARFPEFEDTSTYTDARVQIFIEDATLVMGIYFDGAWCGQYDRAQAYLVAHLLSMALKTAAVNPVSSYESGRLSSRSAGGVSVSYTDDNASTDGSSVPAPYNKTSYGQTWWSIKNSCPDVGGLSIMVACV